MISETSRPTIALLTDFGTHDWFVGVMKGVIAGGSPEANVIDITHEIEPQNVVHGAFVLSASWQYFPRETVFIAVVDPEVGSARDGVIVRYGGQWFVGPNNGLFGWMEGAEAWRLTEASATASATFHGRDVFAPAATRLAAGVPRESVAPEPTQLVACPRELACAEANCGEILFFDHFGNAITNWKLAPDTKLSTVSIEGRTVPIVRTYAAVPEGSPLAYVGSTGHLEIAVRNGSAKDSLNLKRGAQLTIA